MSEYLIISENISQLTTRYYRYQFNLIVLLNDLIISYEHTIASCQDTIWLKADFLQGDSHSCAFFYLKNLIAEDHFCSHEVI
jgi:hypothetical protein